MKKKQKGTEKKERVLEKVVVTLLVVFVSLLSFSVGVMSGKSLSDKEYAQKSIDENYKEALNEVTPEEQDNLEQELSDEEIEQLANAALEEADKTEANNAEVNADPNSENSTQANTANSQNENERVPSSVSKNAASVGYTIQVASFPELKFAEDKAAKLVQKGYAAFPMKVDVKGKTWYRVSVGSFKTRKQALAYRKDLNKAGYAKDSIVRKVTN